ncbi:MAG: SRPBCC domain-containing protein [Bacteroidota bacterium]|nr:SRPBCC domain-containing protein [Bacteroidota bacterium]
MVFKAFSDRKLLEDWLGCLQMKVKYEKFEPKAGGSYRYISTMENGMSFGFHGVCHDFSRPERIIQTFEFEGLPETGHVVLETTKFEELSSGRTKVTVQSVFQSVADRDGMVAAGMEHGVVDAHNRLDEMIEENLIQ